ncbi:MAG: hypothetical protein ACREJM_14360 [Candidatus Saccharimonadales bacterium]
MANIIGQIDSLCDQLELEDQAEGDNSPLPAQCDELRQDAGELLVALSEEETAELNDGTDVQVGALWGAGPGNYSIMMGAGLKSLGERIAKITDTKLTDKGKARLGEFVKYGARHSAQDQDHLDTAHKHVAQAKKHLEDLGANADDEKDNKPAGATGDDPPKAEGNNEKAQLAESLRKISGLQTELDTLRKEKQEWSKQPAPTKGHLLVVPKTADADLNPAAAPTDAELKAETEKLERMTPEQRVVYLAKLSNRQQLAATRRI